MSITSLRISRPTRFESKRKEQEWNSCVLALLQSVVVYLMQQLRGSRRGRRIPLLAERAPMNRLSRQSSRHTGLSQPQTASRGSDFRLSSECICLRRRDGTYGYAQESLSRIRECRCERRKKERETHKESLAQGDSSSFLSEIHTFMRRTQALYKAKDRRASHEDLLWQ